MGFRGQQGFTLVELLVALTIFAVGLLAIAGMQLTGLEQSTKAFTQDIAGNLAQGAMEDILSHDGGDAIFVNTTGKDYDFYPNKPATDWSEAGGGTYSGTYSITMNTSTDHTKMPIDKLAKVEVTVTDGVHTATLTGYKRLP